MPLSQSVGKWWNIAGQIWFTRRTPFMYLELGNGQSPQGADTHHFSRRPGPAYNGKLLQFEAPPVPIPKKKTAESSHGRRVVFSKKPALSSPSEHTESRGVSLLVSIDCGSGVLRRECFRLRHPLPSKRSRAGANPDISNPMREGWRPVWDQPTTSPQQLPARGQPLGFRSGISRWPRAAAGRDRPRGQGPVGAGRVHIGGPCTASPCS